MKLGVLKLGTMTVDEFNKKWNDRDFFLSYEDGKFLFEEIPDDDDSVVIATADDKGVVHYVNNSPLYSKFGIGVRHDFETVVESVVGTITIRKES